MKSLKEMNIEEMIKELSEIVPKTHSEYWELILKALRNELDFEEICEMYCDYQTNKKNAGLYVLTDNSYGNLRQAYLSSIIKGTFIRKDVKKEYLKGAPKFDIYFDKIKDEQDGKYRWRGGEAKSGRVYKYKSLNSSIDRAAISTLPPEQTFWQWGHIRARDELLLLEAVYLNTNRLWVVPSYKIMLSLLTERRNTKEQEYEFFYNYKTFHRIMDKYEVSENEFSHAAWDFLGVKYIPIEENLFQIT